MLARASIATCTREEREVSLTGRKSYSRNKKNYSEQRIFQVITSAHGITRASSSNSAQHNKIWAPRLKKTVFKLWRQVLIFKLYLRNFKLRMRVYHLPFTLHRPAQDVTLSNLVTDGSGRWLIFIPRSEPQGMPSVEAFCGY